MNRFVLRLFAIGLLLTLCPSNDALAEPSGSATVSYAGVPDSSSVAKNDDEENSRNTEQQKTRSRSKRKSSAYTSWKRHLPFWPRKAYLLVELSLFITLGVLFAQVLEVSGAVKVFAILAWPVITGFVGALAMGQTQTQGEIHRLD